VGSPDRVRISRIRPTWPIRIEVERTPASASAADASQMTSASANGPESFEADLMELAEAVGSSRVFVAKHRSRVADPPRERRRGVHRGVGPDYTGSQLGSETHSGRGRPGK